MRFLIIFIFLITNVVAEELPGIKNIVMTKMIKKLISMNILGTY